MTTEAQDMPERELTREDVLEMKVAAMLANLKAQGLEHRFEAMRLTHLLIDERKAMAEARMLLRDVEILLRIADDASQSGLLVVNVPPGLRESVDAFLGAHPEKP